MANARCLAIGVLLATAAPGTAGGPPFDTSRLLVAGGLTDAADRAKVDAGGAVFTVLPARGRDLAVFGITRTEAGGARLAAWTRDVEQLYRGRYMPALRRFSDPPGLDDLATLTLDDQDVNDLRRCRPGDCAVKLGAREIENIRQAATAAGAEWKAAVQLAFRRALLARAQAYLTAGLSGAPSWHDHRKPLSPAAEFGEIAARLDDEPLDVTYVLPYLDEYSAHSRPAVESFLYWSKETLGSGKPIVGITHVVILADPGGGTPATVAARQVYASHYLTASLSVTMIAGGDDGSPQYLVYLRRSRTDAFAGTFGTLVRATVERRIRSEAPPVLDALRRKLESGNPQAATGRR